MKTEGKHSRGEADNTGRKKKMPVGRMILLDVLAIAVGLVVFALFHHVLPTYYGLFTEKTEPVVLMTLPPQPTPEPAAAPAGETENGEPDEPETPEEPEATPESVRVYNGVWGEKFADKFTEGEVIQTENSYQSANINVTVERVEADGIIYYVADVYVCDLKYLRSAFANGKFNGGFQKIEDIAGDVNAVVALSGDHYAGRWEGIVVRNGELLRENRFADICVLLSDGTMVTMTNAELDMDNLKASAPYQVWSFGPELLDDEGKAMTTFNSTVIPANPRAAIGYVEPGHYYLVEVEGSRSGAWSGSRGMTMQELSQLFESLGCKSAYNLDGGRSVGMAWMGERISFDYNRTIPDIIYVTDAVPEDAAPAEEG